MKLGHRFTKPLGQFRLQHQLGHQLTPGLPRLELDDDVCSRLPRARPTSLRLLALFEGLIRISHCAHCVRALRGFEASVERSAFVAHWRFEASPTSCLPEFGDSGEAVRLLFLRVFQDFHGSLVRPDTEPLEFLLCLLMINGSENSTRRQLPNHHLRLCLIRMINVVQSLLRNPLSS